MGCGGSRADAIIEPRYNESWTRETESTWLTNTDVETPLPAIHGKGLEGSGLREKRMVNTGTQCGKQALPSSGSSHQRRTRRSITEVPGSTLGLCWFTHTHTHTRTRTHVLTQTQT
ncbi:Brain and acute leukemia cytoplasmic protein [Merluccius polli]|uniref:Brain and acute leukemia cytoplasmic protein n=1 Tax=Merluccius polli TaxID=89951 RepID=A0AA47ME69_MERPO|nr:Brain and acute leukemia cytoplasmic protein [Merluccius polli]